MARAIWKGAISFGLVHVPVALYPASQDSEIDFDWLDKRTMDPVGYRRINKRTGKEVDRENIVKGVRQSDGDYVVLSEDELRAAYPTRTQTIDIEAFVRASEVPIHFFERPFYLAPEGRSDKVYALLREAMTRAELVAIARLVMHTKEHLVALTVVGAALMLVTLRWANEVRATDEIKLPTVGAAANKLKDAELKMARQLIEEMRTSWKPERFSDTFSDAIRKLIARKVKSGDTQVVTPLEAEPDARGVSNVIDLTALLKRSLKSSASDTEEPKRRTRVKGAIPRARVVARRRT